MTRDATRYLFEIGIFDFQCQGLSFKVSFLYARWKFNNKVIKFYQQGRRQTDIFKKSVLTANRLPRALGDDGTLVNASCIVIERRTSLSKHHR